jgi:serine/threonine-protein kinase RsbT
MNVLRQESLPIRSSDDVVIVRQTVRAWGAELGFSLIDQTKIVTAASELARNTIIYGKGGEVVLQSLHDNGRRGLRLTFQDNGPGIPDIERALRDGFTTGDGLGLGLGGARRLSNEFAIESRVGAGTRVTIARWSR